MLNVLYTSKLINTKHRNFSSGAVFFATSQDKDKGLTSNMEAKETRSGNSDLSDSDTSKEKIKEDKGKERASHVEPDKVNLSKGDASESSSSDEDLKKAIAMSLSQDVNSEDEKGESSATAYQRTTKMDQYTADQESTYSDEPEISDQSLNVYDNIRIDTENAGNPRDKNVVDRILANCITEAERCIEAKRIEIEINLEAKYADISSDSNIPEEKKTGLLSQAWNEAEQEKEFNLHKIQTSSNLAFGWVDKYKNDFVNSPGVDDNFGEGPSNITYTATSTISTPAPIKSVVTGTSEAPVSNEFKNKQKADPKDPKDPGENSGGPSGSAMADPSPDIVSQESKGKRKLDHIDPDSPDSNNENKVSMIDKFVSVILGYIGLAIGQAIEILMQIF
jgi:hypothetical protein